MAYADATHTGRKLGTGAVVLLIEAGLGVALVTGLAATGSISPREIVNTFDVPEAKPTTPPPPPVDRTVKRDDSVIDKPDTLVKLPPVGSGPITSTEDLGTGSEGTSVLGEVAFPTPQPSITPPPLFKPKSAAPKGAWKQWVTTNDYPTQELRMEHEGTARYRLSVDSAGKVSDCTITASSGFAGLDRATCDTVRRRARFEPATDEAGARTAGSFSGAVTWQIPKE